MTDISQILRLKNTISFKTPT